MKKISYILLLAVIGMFLMTAVCAADLQTHDFDGHFKMDVPKDASIKQVNDTYETGAVYLDEKNNITFSYTDKENYAGSLESFTVKEGTKMYSTDEYSIMEFPDGINMVTFIDETHIVQVKAKMAVEDIESMMEAIELD